MSTLNNPCLKTGNFDTVLKPFERVIKKATVQHIPLEGSSDVTVNSSQTDKISYTTEKFPSVSHRNNIFWTQQLCLCRIICSTLFQHF
jgi:5'(3')-deoxyribonucleotidase